MYIVSKITLIIMNCVNERPNICIPSDNMSSTLRSVYTALVLVVLNYSYYQLACLLPAAPYYRKYFKMRFESLEKDKVDIERCKFVQLKMRVYKQMEVTVEFTA